MISGELCLHSFAFEEVRVRGVSRRYVAPLGRAESLKTSNIKTLFKS